MTLQRGEILGYDFNRMVVEFTMLNEEKIIPCAISTEALDGLETGTSVKTEERVNQFERLRPLLRSGLIKSSRRASSRLADAWCCEVEIFDNRSSRLKHLIQKIDALFALNVEIVV